MNLSQRENTGSDPPADHPGETQWPDLRFPGGIVGAGLWFGGWALLHQEQVRRYPEYFATYVRTESARLSLFGPPQKARARYQLRSAALLSAALW